MKHVHENDALTLKVETLSKQLKQAETKKIQDETELKTLRSQYEKVAGEIKQMGVDPKKAQDELKSMDDEINELLLEIEKSMPAGI